MPIVHWSGHLGCPVLRGAGSEYIFKDGRDELIIRDGAAGHNLGPGSSEKRSVSIPTMPTEVIMTSERDQDLRLTADVFALGGDILLPKPSGQHEPLAAISFVRHAAQDLRAARREALESALSCAFASTKASGQMARLVISHGTGQADSVRARFSSPLKRLKEKGHVFLTADWQEVMTAEASGLKWFADVNVDISSVATLESVFFETPLAVVVVGCAASVLHTLLERGWGDVGVESNEFLRDTALLAERDNWLVIRALGAFDDREVCAVILGRPETLRGLYDGRAKRDSV